MGAPAPRPEPAPALPVGHARERRRGVLGVRRLPRAWATPVPTTASSRSPTRAKAWRRGAAAPGPRGRGRPQPLFPPVGRRPRPRDGPRGGPGVVGERLRVAARPPRRRPGARHQRVLGQGGRVGGARAVRVARRGTGRHGTSTVLRAPRAEAHDWFDDRPVSRCSTCGPDERTGARWASSRGRRRRRRPGVARPRRGWPTGRRPRPAPLARRPGRRRGVLGH